MKKKYIFAGVAAVFALLWWKKKQTKPAVTAASSKTVDASGRPIANTSQS